MEAEYDRGKVERDEAEEKIGQRVVVCCNEGVGCRDTMVPGLVETCHHSPSRAMEELPMDIILHDLHHVSVPSLSLHTNQRRRKKDKTKGRRTFLDTIPTPRCFASFHGLGK